MERRLITTDCHIAPPHSLVEELPESYREYFPRLVTRDDGTYMVPPTNGAMAEMMATRMRAMGGMSSADVAKGRKIEGDGYRSTQGNCKPEAQPTLDPAAQLADLEKDGVYGAVLIGGLGNFGGMPVEVDVAYCQVVNDYLADSWGPYLDRIAPGIHLPLQDINASVKELERAAGLGLRPALMPDGIFDRPYHLPEWEPLWEALNGLKIPVTMHVGPHRLPAAYAEREINIESPARALIGWYSQCVNMGETLGWLTFGGVFERYPDLHVVMTEGYAAWMAFAMQLWDHHWTDTSYNTLGAGRGTKPLEALPSFYLKRQAHATFMWDPLAIETRERTGLDCLLWGNDYPHHEGSFPESQAWVDKMFAGVPEAEIDQMTRGNAAKIFNIKV